MTVDTNQAQQTPAHLHAHLKCSLDVIIHHFDVGLVHTDGAPS